MTIATTSDELWAAVETFDAEAAEIAIAKLIWDVPLSGAVTGESSQEPAEGASDEAEKAE